MENRRQSPAVILFFLAAAVAVQSQAQWSAGSSTDPAVPTYRLGAVGIGLAGTPPAQLAVNQSADTVGGGLRVIRTNATGYADFYIGGNNQAYIQVNGSASAYLTLRSDGHVGIGTPAPAASLDTTGTIRVSGTGFADSGSGMEINAGALYSYNRGTSQYNFLALGDSLYIPAGSSSNRNVGIGTTSPRGQLSFNNQIDQTSALPTYTVTTGGNNGQNILNGYYSNVDSLYSRYFDIAATGSPDGTYGGSVIRFLTNPATSGASALERMRIDRSGNVGIGATSPKGQLSINNQVDQTAALLTYAATSGGTGQNILNGYYSNVDNLYSRYFDIAAIGSPDGTYGGSVIRFLTNPANSNAAVERMRIDRSGNVGIGTPTTNDLLTVGAVNGTGNKLTVNGDVTVTGNLASKFQDIAEWVPVAESMPAGTVVVVSADSSNTVTPSRHAYDTGVAGVVSGQPGITLGEAAVTKAKIATTGRVKVRVDAATHSISRGDLLVTSDKPGTAMFSEPIDLGGVKIHRPGTLIGKALEPLATGQGEILVLLSLQ